MAEGYLDANNIDDLGRMVAALLAELWTVRDRMAITEAMLVEQGLIDRDRLDAAPGPALAAELEKLRDRMVANVVGAPLAATDRSVDAVIARAGLRREKEKL